MLWINFLHFYQPATADAHTIKEATEKSYLRIIRALEEHPRIKFTLNITGCLLERWAELGYGDFIERIKKLIKRGQIEIVGTAFYHPLLPLIPEEEAKRQIKTQEKILKKYFNGARPRGFFFPEMAYSEKAGKLVKKLGYEWVILDEISALGKLNAVKTEQVYSAPFGQFASKKNSLPERCGVYHDNKSDLKVVFRSRAASSVYFPDKFPKIKNKNKIFITATDGELYGLKHEDPTAELEKMLDNKNLKTQTISEFIKKTPLLYKEGLGEVINLIPSNWESSKKELKNKMPYALWFDKKNKIQNNLWQLANFAYATIARHQNDKNYYWARWHLSRGFSSCSFWWASGRDFRHVFGPQAWGPDEIEKGANELVRSVRTLANTTTRKTKLKAEKMYIQLKHLIWRKHWSYYWEK